MSCSWLDLFHLHLAECRRCDGNPFDLCGKGDALMRAAASVIVLGAGTDPHRATDGISHDSQRTTHHERTLVMSKSPTGETSTAGSNPAGVASPTSAQDTASPARTELRSVSNDEIRPIPQCSECGRPIDHTGTSKLCIEHQRAKDLADSGLVVAELEAEAAAKWSQAASDPGNPVLLAADQFNAAQLAQPEVRRCTALVAAGGDVLEDECGAILGADLHCEVCDGQLCYQHCAGVDHFKGNTVSRGGAGRFDWKIVEIASNRFRGQIYQRDPQGFGMTKILATVPGASAEEVAAELGKRVRELEQLAEVPPATSTWAAPGQVVTGFGTDQQRNVNSGVFDLLAASEGKLSHQKRQELLLEVLEWLRGGNEAWDTLAGQLLHSDQDTIGLCRNEHNRQIAELFSRLAGAL